MEVEVITGLIGNMGFPIACVVAMFVMWDKERNVNRENSEKWINAINNNTRVMEQFIRCAKGEEI